MTVISKHNRQRSGARRNFSDHQRRIISELLVSDRVRRSVLADVLGFSPQTMMRAVNPLVEAGVVSEIETLTGDRGKPPRLMSFKVGSLLTIGITLSEGRTIVELADLTGVCQSRSSILRTYASAREQVASIFEAIDNVMQAMPDRNNVVTVAVVAQGYFLTPGRTMVARSDPKGWSAIDLKYALEAHTDLPTTIVNDGKAFAGSLIPTQSSKNFVAFVLSTGIGGGIVIDGQLLSGAFGNAGEFGGMFASGDGRPTESILLAALQIPDWTGWPGLENLSEKQHGAVEGWMVPAASQFRQVFSQLLAVLDFDTVFVGSRMPADLISLLVTRIQSEPLGFKLSGNPDLISSASPRIVARHIPKFSALANRIATESFLEPEKFAVPTVSSQMRHA